MWSIFWNTSTSSTERNTPISSHFHGSRLSFFPGTRFCLDPPSIPEKHLQTVPRAIPDASSAHESHEVSKKAKLAIKSESESCPSSSSSKTSPLEPRRKSLLEEKRAIFQRRRFDSSSSTSDDTMIDLSLPLSLVCVFSNIYICIRFYTSLLVYLGIRHIWVCMCIFFFTSYQCWKGPHSEKRCRSS